MATAIRALHSDDWDTPELVIARVIMAAKAEERQLLEKVLDQFEADLASAHAEICKLQGINPDTHTWPEWSPQANSLRWIAAIRAGA